MYSYAPTGLPTLVWAKVVDNEIWIYVSHGCVRNAGIVRISTDSMTAPVEGSWGLPACTANVPKLCTGDDARGGVSIEPLAGAMTGWWFIS